LVGGAAGIGSDPPSPADDAVGNERENEVRISGIDREQHVRPP
jgi:hypothetical protein